MERRDGEWVKKCIEVEAEGEVPRGRPMKTWWETVQNDMKEAGLRKEDARDRGVWKDRLRST